MIRFEYEDKPLQPCQLVCHSQGDDKQDDRNTQGKKNPLVILWGLQQMTPAKYPIAKKLDYSHFALQIPLFFFYEHCEKKCLFSEVAVKRGFTQQHNCNLEAVCPFIHPSVRPSSKAVIIFPLCTTQYLEAKTEMEVAAGGKGNLFLRLVFSTLGYVAEQMLSASGTRTHKNGWPPAL